MNIVSGIIVIAVTAVLFLKYKPRTRSSLQICLLSGILGVLPLFLTDGPLTLQLVQHFLQAVVLVCCFAKLREERILANRRKARLKNCKCGRSGKLVETVPQQQPRVCA
ncbi:MAG TPA: hypothetical protein VHO94_01790 [Oscillospiraceae bacterium]|nr:hypothetical protein [Oscillospiraceae bacterium]